MGHYHRFRWNPEGQWGILWEHILKEWKNQKDMDKLLDTYDLSKSNQEHINNSNRPIVNNSVKAVIVSKQENARF